MNRPGAKIQLTIPAVEAYLQSKGWTRIVGANRNVIIYRGSSDIEGNPLVVALPARPDLLDYAERLASVIRTVAATEGVSPRQLRQTIAAQQIAPGQKVIVRRGATPTTTRSVVKKAGLQYGLRARNAEKTSA